MDPDRARELLRAERERVEHAIARVHAENTPDDDTDERDRDLADGATELYDKELDEGHLGDLRDQLAAVERAEQRLADGTYGRSIESGEPIPDARLEAVPTAERTVAEQERYERGSA
jgi:DnaK suppressor protein